MSNNLPDKCKNTSKWEIGTYCKLCCDFADSGILCVKVQWQKQLVLNFANTMSKVEAENNCACVLPVFQRLPLARDGKEGPRLRIVLNVCLFFRRKRSD